jgi:hypothetical protein
MSQLPFCFAEQRQELRMCGDLHQSRVQFFAGSLSSAEIEIDLRQLVAGLHQARIQR